MHKIFGKRTKAYFTVEASMLVPLVLIFIAFIFYLTFYLYDRCIIAQDAYILAFRGTLHCKEENEAVKQYVQSESAGQYGNKYIGTNRLIDEVLVDRSTVTVKAIGTMTATGWNFSAEKEAERICPVELIRKVRLAQKIGEKLET